MRSPAARPCSEHGEDHECERHPRTRLQRAAADRPLCGEPARQSPVRAELPLRHAARRRRPARRAGFPRRPPAPPSAPAAWQRCRRRLSGAFRRRRLRTARWSRLRDRRVGARPAARQRAMRQSAQVVGKTRRRRRIRRYRLGQGCPFRPRCRRLLRQLSRPAGTGDRRALRRQCGRHRLRATLRKRATGAAAPCRRAACSLAGPLSPARPLAGSDRRGHRQRRQAAACRAVAQRQPGRRAGLAGRRAGGGARRAAARDQRARRCRHLALRSGARARRGGSLPDPRPPARGPCLAGRQRLAGHDRQRRTRYAQHAVADEPAADLAACRTAAGNGRRWRRRRRRWRDAERQRRQARLQPEAGAGQRPGGGFRCQRVHRRRRLEDLHAGSAGI
jgi:hypothetical protein